MISSTFTPRSRKESRDNRREAASNNLVHFEGMTCKHGHTTRFTSDKHCIRCRYIYNRNKDPQVLRARAAVNNKRVADRKKGLPEHDCLMCHSLKNVQGHHWHGYDEAHMLDVVWLCVKCHSVWERSDPLAA